MRYSDQNSGCPGQTADARSPAEVIAGIATELERVPGAGPVREEMLRAAPGQRRSDSADSAGCVRVLMEAGLIEQAESLCAALARFFPEHPAGFAGLAQVAARRRN